MDPLDAVAPYPRRQLDVTASALIKHFAAFGEMHTRLADEFIGDESQYRTSLGHVVSSFTTVYLLTEIRSRLGVEVADDVARELWSAWQDGEIPPWLWDWADEEGLDHNRIAAAANEVARNLRAKAALLAPDAHPGQTEIPTS
ncbi:hypothetical protein ACIBQ1_09540 [Nonomuraea sp. NPDC050153]|uniref:hypothetical protein n=1 Tax=Nonomuraea sp. NPDC050153 TaxID=3364359 RepID=UPI0037971E15